MMESEIIIFAQYIVVLIDSEIDIEKCRKQYFLRQ